MPFSASALDRYLRALGDELSLTGADARILVVGGAALVLRGTVNRSTVDVDVLAEIQGDTLLIPRPFSEALGQAIARVAASFPADLEPGWMNAAVASVWQSHWPARLPPGLDAAEWRDYGPLAVGIAGRETLIPMKLHAVLDLGASPTFDASGRNTGATVSLTGYDRRHLADLVALAPTDAELEAAAAWVQDQDAGDIDPLLHAVLAHVRSVR